LQECSFQEIVNYIRKNVIVTKRFVPVTNMPVRLQKDHFDIDHLFLLIKPQNCDQELLGLAGIREFGNIVFVLRRCSIFI